MQGYYRFPTIYEDRVVFAAEDDLWEVPASGGVARRLTTNLSTVITPFFSPDGKWLAFMGAEEGPQEVYVMPSQGGAVRRVTWLGVAGRIVGWRGERILFSSSSAAPMRHAPWLYEVAMDGASLERLPYGPANRIALEGKMVVLGRKNGDPARWKRYRGGTAGEIWIDRRGKGNFHPLVDLKGNLADPMFLGGRVYFLSDHEGIGNVYSCKPDGRGLKRHTSHGDFYARNASTDGKRIVYHAGADLYLFDPWTGASAKINVEFHGARAQTHRRFVETAKHLEDYDPSVDGASLALTCRGKSFTMGCWEQSPLQQGVRHGVRYRLVRHLNDGKRVVVCSDEGGEDHLEVHGMDNSKPPRRIEGPDLGRPMELLVSPTAGEVLVGNHRNQLLHVDLKSARITVIDRDESRPIVGFNWSADGAWAAYSCSANPRQSVIKIWNRATGEVRPVTRPVLLDRAPLFDPEGRYLYFLSARVFNPVYDSLHFDLGFPRGTRPYLITLRKEVASPFVPEPEGFGKKDKDSSEKDKQAGGEKKDKKPPKPVTIDFDGIEDRVVAFPVAEAIYHEIGAAKERVFYSVLPVAGALDRTWFDVTPPPRATLKAYDLKTREEKTVADPISSFKVSRDSSALVIRAGARLRVVASDTANLAERDKPGAGNSGSGSSSSGGSSSGGSGSDEPGRKSGWVDLTRVKVSIEPTAEWRQMLAEAWRLQRDHFWTENMSGVAWKEILDRYLPLVDRVSSRHEFADLVWEMQGELGTSHAYELGGDYRKSPQYQQGFLGADFRYDPKHDAWRIARIVPGDTWDAKNAPPLLRPGVNVSNDMLILGVGGEKTNRATPPQKLLANQAGAEVFITVAQPDASSPRTVCVKTLENETILRYRDWVETNRRIVHEKTRGKAGYVHVPDMGPLGYAEFHRYFLAEVDHDGLVVDVRYNGGGHVSQLLLGKLAGRRIGYDATRWMGLQPYPSEAPMGPMVAITNEFAGSDGDIVSHSFKLMKLGKLIGRRTWGGVIGIWPRNALVDGTLTTQPEFSFWFKDVGWSVENYGTDPDIEVDILPQDWAAGKDPQLDRAIREVLREIRENAPLRPDLSKRPNLGFRPGK